GEVDMKKRHVLIRKYSDRRLYDTSASRYVKLEDIARMMREGIDVQVRDARSDKDLTSMVLTPIIVGGRTREAHCVAARTAAATRQGLGPRHARVLVLVPPEYARSLSNGPSVGSHTAFRGSERRIQSA